MPSPWNHSIAGPWTTHRPSARWNHTPRFGLVWQSNQPWFRFELCLCPVFHSTASRESCTCCSGHFPAMRARCWSWPTRMENCLLPSALWRSAVEMTLTRLAANCKVFVLTPKTLKPSDWNWLGPQRKSQNRNNKQPSPPIISPANLPQMMPQQNLQAVLAASAPSFMTHAQQSDLHSIQEQLPYLSDPTQYFSHSLATQNAILNQLNMATNPLLIQNQLASLAQLQQQQHINGILNTMTSASSAVTPLQAGNPSINPPCSTLFVANLGTNVNEDEVRQLFKTQMGFSRLRSKLLCEWSLC